MRPPQHRSSKAKQRGAALMVMLVVMILGISAVVISSLGISRLTNARREITADALARAKEGLIGRAVADTNLPGSLPCPDTNDDGSAELLSGNDCPSYIGRLPWRTLGLPDLRDGSNERLWYALSARFRDDSSARPLNSNTKGTLLVYRADGTNLQTEAGYSAVAVIFAPGAPLGSQTRNTVAEQNSAANYLETANGRNNASASGPYIAGAKSDTFNDQLLFITTRHLMPLVEQRVAGEVKRVLANYYTSSGCNCYPWADSVDQFADYDSNYGLNRGWLPNNSLPVNWAGSSVPTSIKPPQWFFDNEWYKLIYYSVAESYTDDPYYCHYYGSCINSTLRVDGVSGARALFFMPGTFAGTRTPDTLSDYLEDSGNNDDANDRYVTPTSQAADRDRIYRLP